MSEADKPRKVRIIKTRSKKGYKLIAIVGLILSVGAISLQSYFAEIFNKGDGYTLGWLIIDFSIFVIMGFVYHFLD